MISKSNIKAFIVGSICTVMVTTTVAGFASGGGILKNISAYYNNIKLVVDGHPVSLGKDLAGNKIEPFAFNGSTYLPIRAVGEALGEDVDWDGKTQTVYVGKLPSQKPGDAKYITEVLDAVMVYGKTYKLKDKEKLQMGGKTYNTGHSVDNWHGDFIYFNLDSRYKEIEGEIGTISPSMKSREAHIYLDDKLHKTINLAGDISPQKLTIPVSGVNQIKIQMPGRDVNSVIGLGDFKLK